jgi:hypothetical protein
MEALGGILSAFGLSASAGLNAYVPLLIVALVARFTNWIELGETWNALTSWWVIGALIVLGLIEFFADKVPAVNHINDVVQTFIRPTAGAVLFAASTDVVTNIHPVIALIAGLLISGSVHAVKSAAIRPAVTATTGGTGNIPVSIAEDLLATVLSILAVVIPVIIAALIVLVTAWLIWLLWRRANRTHDAEWD